MAYEIQTRVQVDGTIKDLQRLYGKEWPRMLAGYIGDMAAASDSGVTLRTRQQFDLHSEYIPKSIRSTPSTPSQLRKVENSLKKYYDGFGAVYLRGSYDERRSMSFMAHHEIGNTRKPTSSWRSVGGERLVATPQAGLKSKVFRSSSGRVKKRYKPSELLERFDSVGSVYKHGTTITRKYPGRRGPGKAKLPGAVFLIKGRNSGLPIAVRRVTRGGGSEKKGKLETLYAMHKEAEVKGGVWQFEETVIRVAKLSHRRIAKYNSAMVVSRFKRSNR